MAGKGFTKEQAEKGHLAIKIRSKALSMLKDNGDIDLESLKNSEEAKRLAELGVDVDAKIAEMVEKAKAMFERSKSKKVKGRVKGEEMSEKESFSNNVNKGIDQDLIKQAVNECIQGQCELLDKLVSRVESFQDVIDKIRNEIADIKNIKPEVDTSSIEERIAKIESEIEQLKNLPDGVAQKVKESVNPEIEGIAKETLSALMEIKADQVKQSKFGEEVVPVNEALKNEKYRDAVLKEIERTIMEDKEAFEALRNLIAKCQAGDQNACDILAGNVQRQQQSDIDKKLSDIFERLNKIDEAIKSKTESAKKEDVEQETTSNNVRKELKQRITSNPLRKLLFS